jgi:hypothetical protein
MGGQACFSVNQCGIQVALTRTPSLIPELLDGVSVMGNFPPVGNPAHPRDEDLVGAVFAAARSKCTRAGVCGLVVGAKAGTVTLHGLAGSFYEKQLLLHAAQHVPGVLAIVDEVDVLSPAER